MRVEVHKGTPIKMWTDGVQVEEEAMAQLRNVASLPFVRPWVAVMPDVHLGMGATVGSVIPTEGAIIPAAVGVDIGCGMNAVPIGVKRRELPDLSPIREAIERAVPHGRTNNGGEGDRGAWGDIPPDVLAEWVGSLSNEYQEILVVRPNLGRNAHPAKHLGTLGTGNHFIELCADEGGSLWVVLHSGSRGIGNRIGLDFTREAKEACKKWFISLPDPDLAYFPAGTPQFGDYLGAAAWAQKFARLNRHIMMKRTLTALERHLGPLGSGEQISCHHNYVARERHFGRNVFVTRKGAVNAEEGTLGIIPGAMGQKSYIVEGLGNRESFNSCSHGAGRKMSRTAAKKTFTLEDLKTQTEGAECRKDEGVLDEIPGAYKDLDAVMAAQTDLVKIVHTLRALITVKG